MFDLVEVTWDDHCFHAGDVEPAEAGLAVQVSIGWRVAEDDKVIKLAQSRAVPADSPKDKPTWGEVLVIDKRMLVRKRVLRGR